MFIFQDSKNSPISKYNLNRILARRVNLKKLCLKKWQTREITQTYTTADSKREVDK